MGLTAAPGQHVVRNLSERGNRLSRDWTPSEEDIAWAEKIIANWRWEFDKFKDYWLSKSGASAVKLDWSLTFRNWIRRAVESGVSAAPPLSAKPTITPDRGKTVMNADWLARMGWKWISTPNGMKKVPIETKLAPTEDDGGQNAGQ